MTAASGTGQKAVKNKGGKMNGCKGIVGFLFGHKFKARQDSREGEGKWPFQAESFESKTAAARLGDYGQNSISSIVKATKETSVTYVRDVCARCGTTIERETRSAVNHLRLKS